MIENPKLGIDREYVVNQLAINERARTYYEQKMNETEVEIRLWSRVLENIDSPDNPQPLTLLVRMKGIVERIHGRK